MPTRMRTLTKEKLQKITTSMTQEEIDALDKAPTRSDWDRLKAKVKADRDGHWPADWPSKIDASGIRHRAETRFLAQEKA